MTTAPPPGSTGDLTTAPASRRCDNCGAPISFDPASGELRCRHCRSATAIEAPAGEVAELDYLATVGDRAGTDDELEPVRLQCADCGAPADHPPNTLAASCPYCHVPFVGTPTSTRTLMPGGILPLTVTEDQARTNTRTWLGNRWFAPRHLDKVATQALRSAATPAWIFSMSSTADYRGRRGDNYLDTETYTTTDSNGNTSTHTRTVTKIRWRSASGTVHLDFRGVTAFAGRDPLSRFGEELEPWGIDDVVPYRDDYLRGSVAQTYTRPPAAGLDRARERTTDALEDAIRRDIGGDHQEIGDVDRRDRDIGFRYVLVPGWEATYRHRDDTYQLAVNGRTGTVDGTRPYSKVKIAIAVGAAIAAIALVIFLVTRSSSQPGVAPSTTRPTTTTVAPTSGPSTEVIAPTTAPTTAAGAATVPVAGPTTTVAIVATTLDPSGAPTPPASAAEPTSATTAAGP